MAPKGLLIEAPMAKVSQNALVVSAWCGSGIEPQLMSAVNLLKEGVGTSMIGINEYVPFPAINLKCKWNDPLVINMPETEQSLETRLFPRGTPSFYKKHDVMLLDAVGTSMYRSIASYHVDLGSLEPMKAFSSPHSIDAIQKELTAQKQPGGILYKYGVQK